MSEKIEPQNQPGSNQVGNKDEKVGNVEIEEQVHHEHVEEISPELEALLKTDPLQGLTDDEVERRRATFGRNELIEKKRHPFLKFLGYFTGAIAYLIEIAVICSAVVGVSIRLQSLLLLCLCLCSSASAPLCFSFFPPESTRVLCTGRTEVGSQSICHSLALCWLHKLREMLVVPRLKTNLIPNLFQLSLGLGRFRYYSCPFVHQRHHWFR